MHFPQQHLLLTLYDTVRITSQRTATDADGMNLGHIIGNGTKGRHRPKRNPLKIHVEPGYYHPNTLISNLLTNMSKPFIKELRFVYSYHFYFGGKQQDVAGMFNRR